MTLRYAPSIQFNELPLPPAPVVAVPPEVVLGVVGRSTGTAAPAVKPAIRQVTTLAEANDYLGDAVDNPNELALAVAAIYAQVPRVPVVLSLYDDALSGAPLATAITNAVNALAAAETTLGVKPNIIWAPGLTYEGGTTPTVATSPVVTRLAAVANSLDAIGIPDTPPPAASAANDLDFADINGDSGSWIANNHSRYLVGVDGWTGTRAEPIPGSSYYAGALARLDAERGFWRSPHGQTVFGLGTQLRQKTFDGGVGTADEVDQFANVGIASFVRFAGGISIWGDSLLLEADDTTSTPRTVHGLRTEEHVKEEVLTLGRGFSVLDVSEAEFVPVTTARMNGLLQGFVSQGALTRFTVSASPDPTNRRRVTYRVAIRTVESVNQIVINFGVER